MLSDLAINPLAFIFWIVALLIAITVHEFSHALAADRLGDPTPRLQGRLTLNPLAHLDPLGTIMLILVRFGWGKPVVFDPFNLRNPLRDGALISLAGPFSNLVTATAGALILKILTTFHLTLISNNVSSLLVAIAVALLEPVIVLNVILAIFNLIPIHPLDGFKIVEGFLSKDMAKEWEQLEPYGLIFLLFLVLPIFGGTAPIVSLISPVINFILGILIPGAPVI